MISRDQLKADIDRVDERNIEVLHKIILALAKPASQSESSSRLDQTDPLKGSVTFERDILSPIGDDWSAEQ